MRAKEWKQITFNIANGSPAHRKAAAEEAIPVLRQRLNRLREKAESQSREFAATLSAWTSRDASPLMRPVAIEQDLREAKVVHRMAVFLTVTELALSFFVSLVFAVSAPFLFLLALVSIFALKVGLVSLWRNAHQPQQTRRRLRNFVIAPSLGVTMLALAALMLVRTAGIFALVLLPLINLAIAVLSLGVLGLAGGLFALGYLLSWSRHAEARYNALEGEAVETRRVLQQAERVVNEAGARNDSAAAPADPHRRAVGPAAGRARSLTTTLLLFLSLWAGACKMPEAVTASTPAPDEQRPSRDEATLEIWLDWSLSAEEAPYREAAASLVAALPALAEAHHLVQVTAWHFGNDGWNATRVFDLGLPRPRRIDPGEAERLFGKIGEGREAQALDAWRKEMRASLAQIDAAKLLPSQTPEPRCTDLIGACRRISEPPARGRRLVFLLSDGDDTCSRAWPSISLRDSRTAVVFVLLPGHANDEKNPAAPHSLSHQQWEDRRALLTERLPGVVIIPHFGDFIASAERATRREGDAATRR